MKKGFPLIAVLLLLLRLAAAGQTPPTLQITNADGNAVLSAHLPAAWPFALQTTTNLTHPIIWTDLSFSNITNLWFGYTNGPTDNPQQFFRLAETLPIFQFAIFYNLDLEMAFAQTFVITGPVFSNGGIWTGSLTITFANTVSAVGIATNTPNDPFCIGYIGSGKSTYKLPGQPASGTAPLTLTALGTNASPAAARSILDLPPPDFAIGTAAAYSTTGADYLANEVDLFLTNFPNGTNWGNRIPKGTNMALFYQDAANIPYLTFVPFDFYLLTNRIAHIIYFTNTVSPDQLTNTIYAGYSFVTNDIFFDWREGWNAGAGPPKGVQGVQIDIARFNIWLTNSGASNNGIYYNSQCELSKGHPIDSIYIYNAVPLTSTTLPAVRVINGGMLPSQTAPYGFTIVTPQPMYVYGNYNASNSFGSSLGQNSTTYTWPAALMADSITILSGIWLDGVTSRMPSAVTTTINAAILAGIVPSTNSLYSGGVENFLRTLENWGSSTLWYNGSIVAMFPSQYATNSWQQTGNYYAAPNRHFAFDTNFDNLAGLPPLTPNVVNHVTP